MTPLSGPEKVVVRSNALKSLDVKKYPQIRFSADDIAKTDAGYRMTGTSRSTAPRGRRSWTWTVDDHGGTWVMSAQLPVVQTQFGVKPYSLLMGTLKINDEVTVKFTARHPK